MTKVGGDRGRLLNFILKPHRHAHTGEHAAAQMYVHPSNQHTHAHGLPTTQVRHRTRNNCQLPVLVLSCLQDREVPSPSVFTVVFILEGFSTLIILISLLLGAHEAASFCDLVSFVTLKWY